MRTDYIKEMNDELKELIDRLETEAEDQSLSDEEYGTWEEALEALTEAYNLIDKLHQAMDANDEREALIDDYDEDYNDN